MENAEFILYIGAYPGHSGKPMQTIGRQVALRAAAGKLKFVVVDPVMAGGAITPIGNSGKWIPIKPTTDSAFAMGMIHWMVDNNRINTDYLSSPNFAAAKSKGFNSWTNAAHLVIMDPEHPNYRKVLRAEDLGLPVPSAPEPDPKAAAPTPPPDYFVVMDKATGKPMIYDQSNEGDLIFKGEVTDAGGKVIKVQTAFMILKDSVFQKDLADYSKICGVPEETIIEIAREFTSHGTKAAVDGMGNTAASTGFDASMAQYVLSALIGSMNKRGGNITRRNSYKSIAAGPRYDLAGIPDKPKAAGLSISRAGVPYEKTTEFKNHKAKGENPYPSKLPWHPVGGGSDNQTVFSVVNGYPYQAKILMFWMSNPLITTPAAAHQEVLEALKNVERVPLIIGIDAFMGESTAVADYIIPDTTPYESWALANSEGNCSGKVLTLRWPVVEPMTAKISENRYACFENFCIDIAKSLGLPGFGDNAIKGADQKLYPLNNPEDLFLRGAANAAYDGKPVPDISASEMKLQDLETATAAWKKALNAEEYPKTLYLMARGGRFEDAEGFEGDNSKYPYKGCTNIYVEKMATAKNSITGKNFSGTLVYNEEGFADGTLLKDKYPVNEWPFKGVSYKAKFRSVSMLANTLLRDLNKTNAIEINPLDAAELNLKNGDKVKLIAATGGEAAGTLLVRQGVSRGTVAVAFGYGHWEYGSKAYQVDGKKNGGDSSIASGVLLSGISLTDPTVKGVFGFSEMSTGGPSRNGGAFRIEKA
ncbi:molybdopterin-dependent oxidoreductase [Desulfitobacterium sp.]|uniref:molybdopterin-dependent oxidoreductase n=1 Tax=Desulfitobacterium sp. TaxID=49981 RepID=UPI002B1FCDA9|nr:molybdopterin-dependent oxidoreductase [Desulfitobacterium sp.]